MAKNVLKKEFVARNLKLAKKYCNKKRIFFSFSAM